MDLRDGCIYECPGCAHRLLGAEESETQKQTWLEKSLAPWVDKIRPISGLRGDARWQYRARVCLSAIWIDSSWQFGLIRRDELIPVPNCPVHVDKINKAMSLLADCLPKESDFPVAFYVQSGAQVVIVAKTDKLPEIDWCRDDLWEKLRKEGVDGLWLHLFPSAGKKVFAKNRWYLIRGKERSIDQRGLMYGPAAFQQLIPTLYDSALDKMEAFLSPCKKDIVVDLYCGNGSTLKLWTEKGAEAIGIELGAEAVSCALENAPKAKVLRGTCANRVPQLSEWAKETDSPDGRRLLYVNPPRTGIEKPVVEWIANKYKPERIAYLSCSAGTLKRDLDYLVGSGYQVEEILPYDFFPQTIHVETLVLLTRYNSTRLRR